MYVQTYASKDYDGTKQIVQDAEYASYYSIIYEVGLEKPLRTVAGEQEIRGASGTGIPAFIVPLIVFRRKTSGKDKAVESAH